MSLEREAKLAAAAGFRMPAMDGLVPGGRALTRPRLQLDATYYDTRELHLSRWGASLRHRAGENGPPWTLKLPGAAAAQTLERRELTFAGGPTTIPPEAADLARAYLRDRPLIPVARLHTTRTPVDIIGPEGSTLAEIVDDAVAVRVGQRSRAGFREIEVELKAEGAAARQVLEAAVIRLTAAGCRIEPPVAKVVRALGTGAARPAEVVVRELGATPSAEALTGHAIASAVVQIIQRDALVRLGDEEGGVHKFRVATRRLRSDLGTFADLVVDERALPLREELRWLGAEVGRLRDNHVFAGNLQRLIATLPSGDAVLAQPLLTRVRRQAGRARAHMLVALRSERYDRLLNALVGIAGAPQQAGELGHSDHDDDIRVVLRLVRKRWRRLATAVNALGDDPPDTALHKVRIDAKRCRYAAEAVVPVAGKPAARFAAAVSELQTVLGDHQDTVVAERWLRDAATALPATALVAGELIAAERAERLRLRAAWPSVWTAVRSEQRRSGL